MTAPVCIISVAEHAGWAWALGVAAPDGRPRVIDRRRLVLIGEQLPTMPYHHESLPMAVDDADALIARVRASIAEGAMRTLGHMVGDLSRSYRTAGLAIRQPPFPALPDSVARVRQSYPLQCAADGMMYQLALCQAARHLGLEVDQCRRGQELSWAAASLDVSAHDIATFVTGTGRPSGPPWTVDHRRAFAAGIAALSSRAGHDIHL